MNWIKVNSKYNPELTELPETSEYTNGSIVVLNTPYGKIEYMMVDGFWEPKEALTDIEMYFDYYGTDDRFHGSEADPFSTTDYGLSLLPPKIKNLNIHLGNNSVNEVSNHFFYIKLQNLIKTSPTDSISIKGMTDPRGYDFTITSISNAYFNAATLLEVGAVPWKEVIGDTLNAIDDSDEEFQRITSNEINLEQAGVKPGMCLYSLSGNHAFIIKVDGFDLYLDATVFDNSELETPFTIGHPDLGSNTIKFNSSSIVPNVCFPVIGGTKTSILISPFIWGNLKVGDSFYPVGMTPVTIDFDRLDHFIHLSNVNVIKWSPIDGESIMSKIKNCPNPIAMQEMEFSDYLGIRYTPNIWFERCFQTGMLDIAYSFNTNPILLDDEFSASDAGINICDSALYPKHINIINSAVSFTFCFISGANYDYHGMDDSLISNNGGYIDIDSTNVLLHLKNISLDGQIGYMYFLSSERGAVINQAGSELNFIGVESPYRVAAREIGHNGKITIQYETRTLMLRDFNVLHDTIGTVYEEPGNRYIYDSNSEAGFLGNWLVCSDNKYAGDDLQSLKNIERLTILTGTIVYNTDTHTRFVWEMPPQAV